MQKTANHDFGKILWFAVLVFLNSYCGSGLGLVRFGHPNQEHFEKIMCTVRSHTLFLILMEMRATTEMKGGFIVGPFFFFPHNEEPR